MPAALQEWLPDDHLAYFISDVVDQLDKSESPLATSGNVRGGPPYHPRMMVKVLLYGYCVGVASHGASPSVSTRTSPSGCWRRTTHRTSGPSPTFARTIWTALSGLFIQVLALCQRAGLVKLGHVALDGTKVKANASKHKAMSYGRMKEKEAQLAAEVAELLERAQATV